MLFHSLSTNCLGDSAMEVDPPAFKAAAASSATSRQQAPPKAFLAPHAASWPLNSAPVPPQQQAPMPPPGIAWMEGGCMRLCARRAADAARSVALNGGRVILEGVAMRASSCPERLQPTRCGRIYPEELLRAVVSRYAERVSRGVAFGELGHPDPEHAHAAACCLGDVCCVRASSLSHRVTRLRWDGDELRVTAELLPTPAGMALRSLVLAGAQVCFSSRGLATLRPMDKGLALVGDDFELVAFDATPEPPHEGAVALAVPYDVAAREARLLAARTALLAARRPSNLLGEIKNLEPSLLDRIVEFVVNEGATDCAQ